MRAANWLAYEKGVKRRGEEKGRVRGEGKEIRGGEVR
jgi:hypothetical protein